MSKKPQRLGQDPDDLLVDEPRNLKRAEGAVGRDHAVELALPAFLDELCTVGGGGLDDLCDLTQGAPRRMRALSKK